MQARHYEPWERSQKRHVTNENDRVANLIQQPLALHADRNPSPTRGQRSSFHNQVAHMQNTPTHGGASPTRQLRTPGPPPLVASHQQFQNIISPAQLAEQYQRSISPTRRNSEQLIPSSPQPSNSSPSRRQPPPPPPYFGNLHSNNNNNNNNNNNSSSSNNNNNNRGSRPTSPTHHQTHYNAIRSNNRATSPTHLPGTNQDISTSGILQGVGERVASHVRKIRTYGQQGMGAHSPAFVTTQEGQSALAYYPSPRASPRSPTRERPPSPGGGGFNHSAMDVGSDRMLIPHSNRGEYYDNAPERAVSPSKRLVEPLFPVDFSQAEPLEPLSVRSTGLPVASRRHLTQPINAQQQQDLGIEPLQVRNTLNMVGSKRRPVNPLVHVHATSANNPHDYHNDLQQDPGIEPLQVRSTLQMVASKRHINPTTHAHATATTTSAGAPHDYFNYPRATSPESRKKQIYNKTQHSDPLMIAPPVQASDPDFQPAAVHTMFHQHRRKKFGQTGMQQQDFTKREDSPTRQLEVRDHEVPNLMDHSEKRRLQEAMMFAPNPVGNPINIPAEDAAWKENNNDRGRRGFHQNTVLLNTHAWDFLKHDVPATHHSQEVKKFTQREDRDQSPEKSKPAGKPSFPVGQGYLRPVSTGRNLRAQRLEEAQSANVNLLNGEVNPASVRRAIGHI